MSKSIRSLLVAPALMLQSSLTLGAATQPGHAADIPGRTPALVAVHNWTGCTIGANAGWIGGADRLTTYPGPTVGPPPGLTPAEIALVTHRHASRNSAGFSGGAQAGCNWQDAGSRLVLGVEVDFNAARLKEQSATVYPPTTVNAIVDIPSHVESVTKKLDWYSTIRGRWGLAHDRWLGYVTGGLAVAHVESSLDWINDGSSIFTGSDSRTRFGWTVGGGIEYALTGQWSARLEYVYVDVGTFTYEVPHVSVDQSWKVDVRAREHVLRVGLNYRLGGPLIARN